MKVSFHFIFIFIDHSIYPLLKFGSSYLGKATAAARAALPIPNSACGIFVCPNKGMAANAWDLKRAHVNACDCTRGLYGHRKRVCTES